MRPERLGRWIVVGMVSATAGGVLLLNLVENRGTDCRNKVPTDLMVLEVACARYAELHAGASPPSLDHLVCPDAQGETLLRGPRLPLDPWGRAYRYEPADSEHPFVRIWTFGRDGLPGGTGEDAEIGNWMWRD